METKLNKAGATSVHTVGRAGGGRVGGLQASPGSSRVATCFVTGLSLPVLRTAGRCPGLGDGHS